MARRSAFRVTVDTSQLDKLVDDLEAIEPAQLAARFVDTLNDVVDSAYDLSRKTILQGINLTDDYVQRKMRVEHATAQKPEASIIASGARADMTSLSHYGSMQLTKPVNWTNERIKGMGKKFGPWPGWTERKGVAAVGIAVGQKADGKSVEVVRGERKRLGSQFNIPGKKDNDGNLIIFRRNKAGKIEALQGPSVYQLFRVAAGRIEDEVFDELETAVTEMAERELIKAIEP